MSGDSAAAAVFSSSPADIVADVCKNIMCSESSVREREGANQWGESDGVNANARRQPGQKTDCPTLSLALPSNHRCVHACCRRRLRGPLLSVVVFRPRKGLSGHLFDSDSGDTAIAIFVELEEGKPALLPLLQTATRRGVGIDEAPVQLVCTDLSTICLRGSESSFFLSLGVQRPLHQVRGSGL